MDFKATPEQQIFFDSIDKHSFNLLKKNPQVGATTILIIKLSEVLVTENSEPRRMCYISPSKITSSHAHNKMLDHLRQWCDSTNNDFSTFFNVSKDKITSRTGSSIIFTTHKTNFIGMYPFDWVVIDEISVMSNSEKLYETLFHPLDGGEKQRFTIISDFTDSFTHFLQTFNLFNFNEI